MKDRLFAGFLVLMAALPVSALAAAQDLVVYSRMSERLLVGLAGMLSLWMGYNLFRVVGQTKSAAADAAISSASTDTRASANGGIEGRVGELISVKMWDVGPGLYFALFGSALLAYVLFSRVDIRIPAVAADSNVSEPAAEVNLAIPGLTVEQSISRITTVVRAIRSLENITPGDSSQNAKDQQARATQNLVNSLPQLLDVGFGKGASATYERLLVLTPAERQKASASDRKTFEAVNAALNNGV
jgi:hypothetical protein